MSTATTERRTETICPPWCEGHDDRYQPWEERCADGRWQRDHAERGVTIGGAQTLLSQIEDQEHELAAPTVALYVDDDVAELSPAQARELAAVLVEKAAQAEARS
jgi:hypothetical protein